MNLSNAIKQLRRQMFLNQNEFGDLLGVSFVTISRREKGISIPNLKKLKILFQLFEDYQIKVNKKI